LKRCRDRTKAGYERYVGLGVLGLNPHVLGKVLWLGTRAAAKQR
jgi:hypothetical protein